MIKKFTQSISAGASLFAAKWLVALALPLLALQVAQAQLNYVATVCSDPYVQAQGQAGTTFIGQGDDVVFANIALPFPFLFYTTSYTTVNIGTNGFILFNPGTNRGLGNATLPTAIAGACMYPFWDDLDADGAVVAGSGVYSRVDGVAPNRIFTVEWYRIGHFNMIASTGDITFQVRLFENGNRIQYKYFDTVFAGAHTTFNNGLSATVGLEAPLPAPRPNTLVGFNTASVTTGQCIEFVLPQACNPIAGPTLNLNTSQGLCAANATIALPAFNPAGCANGTTTGLRYSLNGGAFINVALPAANVVINNMPKGANVIAWQTYIIANGATAGAATQLVNVVDNEKPTISCPQNLIINLAPGECCRPVTWALPTVTDNCPFLVPGNKLFTTTAAAPANFFNAFAGVTFDVRNVGTEPIIIDGFKVPVTGGGAGANFNVYYTTTATTNVGNQVNPAAWTLMGSANGVAINQATAWNLNTFTQVNVGGLALQPGQSKGIYVVITNYTAGGTLRYTNGSFTATDGSLTVLSNGFGGNINFGNTFASRAFVGEVQYSKGGAAVLTQTVGPDNGSELCKENSPYTIQYQVADAAGNSATCSFSITVNPFQNAINSLVCNDLVQVSLDDSCTATIGADQVLEGGPYKCYNDYLVQIDKTLPFGNGPWELPVLGPGDVGKTYQVRVTDPATGNKCWGNLFIEDKLAPVLDCQETFVACNASSFAPCADPITILPSAPLFTINTGGNANSVGGMVFFNITNLSSLPLDITAIGMNMSAASVVNIYAKQGTHVGFETNAAAWQLIGTADGSTGPFSGAFPGNGTITPCPINAPGITLPPGLWGIALHTPTAQQIYTNGNGANQTFTDGTITLNLGSTTNTLWGAPFTPRVWNGFVAYKKEAPTSCLPNGLTLNVNAFANSDGTYRVLAGAGSPVLDYCSEVTLSYNDSSIDEPCTSANSKTITRIWTARDASGNTKTCNQKVSVLRPKAADLKLPPSYDGIGTNEDPIPCGGVYPSPDWIESQGFQGYPYVFGKPSGCDFGWNYDDTRIDVCDGTYKVRRRWTIINWCTSESQVYDQIIKILDEVPPTFTCPANLTVTTDPYTCCGTADLPDLIVTDNCSRIAKVSAVVFGIDPQTQQPIGTFNVSGFASDFPGNNYWDNDTLAVMGSTPCLPQGRHRVVYTVEDDCGNSRTCQFFLTIRDLTPPVPACDEFTVVAIGSDDPFDCYGPAGFQDVPPALGSCEFAGVTWVKATTFDDGSYDNCGTVRFSVRRMADPVNGYSDCIDNLNSIRGTPGCASLFPSFPSEFERAISEGDSIKFYCCEVGTTQMVILRVTQLDVNGNPVILPDGSSVSNECMVEISVQDKIKPVCTPPANVTVSCESFDPSLWAYGKPTVVDNCCLDTGVEYQGQCGLTHTTNISLFDTVCNRGVITRTFRAFDCHGNSSSCTQRVTATYGQDYFVRFPDDKIVTSCNGTTDYGQPTFFGENCELLGVSHEDEVFTVVPDACYKIERTWTVINWCTYNPNLGCTEIPNPNPNAITNAPQNLPGPIISPAGTPAPWNPTTVAVTPGATPTNYAVFYTGGMYNGVQIPNIGSNNCYKYTQLIKVIDTQKPIIADCPASPDTVCDITANNAQLWNEMYWWDATIASHDLCEGPTDLSITATDLCSDTSVSIRYLLFLDLDGDGTMETVINSNQTGLGGLGWNAVPFGNAAGGPGTVRQFDERSVPANQKWGFALQTTTSGVNKTGAVRWNTQQAQGTYVVPELPYGVHKIKWFVEDGCGNEQTCEYIFEVKDCKKPTVVCINGLSVNIMPTKMVALWDTDFLQYTEDNCTPANLLKTAIRKAGQGTGFPRNPDGTPQKVVTFTCNELGQQNVELWSIDLAGNADFCLTYVIVQDNMGACQNNTATVAGALTTESGNGLEDASISLTGTVPAVNLTAVTDAAGQFSIPGVPTPGNYTVTPMKDNDPLNGVSTFDLVLINKHILGLEPLSTPFKMIAADANNSRSITTFDIVELRKLILGIYTEPAEQHVVALCGQRFCVPEPVQSVYDDLPGNEADRQPDAGSNGGELCVDKSR
ncbi:MAG: hypothetical protein IPM98_04525 [Lewinellaceae bacterium]|nr:hypothetical protein [Lewinellaceae bacterium]